MAALGWILLRGHGCSGCPWKGRVDLFDRLFPQSGPHQANCGRVELGRNDEVGHLVKGTAERRVRAGYVGRYHTDPIFACVMLYVVQRH